MYDRRRSQPLKPKLPKFMKSMLTQFFLSISGLLCVTVTSFADVEIAIQQRSFRGSVPGPANAFVWNDNWTFRSRRQGEGNCEKAKRFLCFNLICGTGIVWSVLLLHVQVSVFGLNIWLANIVAIGLGSFWNFGLSNLLRGWRTTERETARAGGPIEPLF